MTDETRTEQRLRDISAKTDSKREDAQVSLVIYPQWPDSIRRSTQNHADELRADRDVIDAGREAIALLRRLEPACYNAASWTAWKADVAELLARCGGQEGT